MCTAVEEPRLIVLSAQRCPQLAARGIVTSARHVAGAQYQFQVCTYRSSFYFHFTCGVSKRSRRAPFYLDDDLRLQLPCRALHVRHVFHPPLENGIVQVRKTCDLPLGLCPLKPFFVPATASHRRFREGARKTCNRNAPPPLCREASKP